MEVYQKINGLPDSVINAVVAPMTKNETVSLVEAFLGADRVGPANVHGMDHEVFIKQALHDPDAEPPHDVNDDTTKPLIGRGINTVVTSKYIFISLIFLVHFIS